jgi:hypothetical protein
MSLREDAKAAREFAYGDVAQAFETWRTAYGGARPFILVGVEQGALMASRLLKERIASDPALKARLVGAYLQRAVIPAEDFAPGSEIPACGKRDEAGCVVGWNEVYEGDDDLAESLLTRALVWGKGGELVSLAGRPALCVNPITGGLARPSASAKDNLGAVNATGLEWGARPAFTRGEVGAACIDGLLRVTAPSSGAFHVSGSWADRSKVPGYNLFYADIEIDALKRTAEWRRRTGTR